MRVLKSFLRPALALLVTVASTLAPQISSPASATTPVVQRSISAGYNSTCALRASNAIYCVGDNSFGQLGDGTKIDSSEPVKVVGLNAALSVSVGKTFACAIGVDQLGYCWGDNTNGQLGSANANGTIARRINLDMTLSDIQVGDDLACATSQVETLYCWGNLGRLVGPSDTNLPVPTLRSIAGVKAVAISSHGLCVLTSIVSCLGTAFSADLTAIPGTDGATALSVGSDFGCAVVAGGVKCWGDNSQGQLGQGNTTPVTGAVAVTGISDVKVLTSGAQFSCVLNSVGASFCWGDNSSNQIAQTAFDQTTRVPTTFAAAADIEAGALYVCALLLDGTIKCLGDNSKAQTAVLTNSIAPIGPTSPVTLTKVSTGTKGTCAIDAAGHLYCWGALIPTLSPDLSFVDVAVGNVSACAVTSVGNVLCWGSNGSSQLGDGTNKSAVIPATVLGLGTSKASHIAAGYRHFCANTSDGLVYCWGDNSHQQLGYIGVDAKTATPVAGIGTAVNISAGSYHSCALLTGSQVYCWGDNSKKQISATGQTKMGVTAITQAAGIAKVVSGGYESCYLMTDNKLNCVGENTDLESPGTLSGTFADVAVGLNSVCVLKPVSSQVSCFGSNSSNKLGRSGLKSATPSDVGSLTALSISVGDENACAVSITGNLKCWGSNSDGQLASAFGFTSAYANLTVYLEGYANVGETITVAMSNSEPNATASYVWSRSSNVKLGGAVMTDSVGSTYVAVKTDTSRYFNVAVKLSKWGTTSDVFTSTNFGPVAAQRRILLSSIPTITGKAKVGKLLSAKTGTWDSGVNFTYQWYRNNSKIAKATSSTYKVVAADVGKQISVLVTGTELLLPKVAIKSLKTAKVTR